IVYLISLWLRNTVPRLRIDQVMGFNWFFLVPISILNVVLTALLVKVFQELGFAPTNFAETSFWEVLPITLALLLKDGLTIFFVMNEVAKRGRQARVEEKRANADLLATAAGD